MEESNKAMTTRKKVRLTRKTAVRRNLRSGDSNSELDAGCFRSPSYEQENLRNTVGRNKRRRKCASNDYENLVNEVERNKRKRKCASNDKVDLGNTLGRNKRRRKDARDYYMNHKNRGTCLVFNHMKFVSEKSKERKGTNCDVKRIRETFKNLGFNVQVVNNATRRKIYYKLQNISETDHTDNDCLCIFVLTHGRKKKNVEYLFASDGWYPSDEIWESFTGDNCPTLVGKPKLFFYVACRGKKVDAGVPSPSMSNESQVDNNASKTQKIPVRSDMLIAHSTANDHVNWREVYHGTPYVQNLCSVIDDYSIKTNSKCDLLEILTLTAHRLATTYQSKSSLRKHHRKRQISSFTSMLTKKVYLEPK